MGLKDTCVDINGEVRSFPEISEYSPFDHVNQVELSWGVVAEHEALPARTEAADNAPAFTSSLISGNPNDMEGAFSFWFLGVVIPAYAWSVAGFFRIF